MKVSRHTAQASERRGPSRTRRLPALAERIAFEFQDGLEGWFPAHDVSGLSAKNGMLEGHVTGGDPYIIRSALRVPAGRCPVIRVRMRVTAGQGGEFYWTTSASPAFAEDKKASFPLVADGQFHEYRLEVGRHALWSGQTITAIRIDPGNGASQADFAVDYVRGGAD